MTLRTTRHQQFERALDVDSAVAAVAFLVSTMARRDLHSLSKALYLADLMHLERYGRTIANERYTAMEYGPVPLTIFNSLCAMRGDERFEIMNHELFSKLRQVVAVENRTQLAPSGEPNPESLSESDLTCLTDAAGIVDANDFGANSDLTHDAAWHAARARRPNAEITLHEMIDQLEHAALIRENLGHVQSD